MTRPPYRWKRLAGALALVVDDSPFAAVFTGCVLEQFGWRVLTAGSGPAGIQAFLERSQEFELVVSDVLRPDGMSGPQMVAWLLCFRPDLPVVFATAAPEKVPVPLRLRFPTIEKPFLAGALIEAVQTALTQREHHT